ncbi:peptidoglycan-recognition protein 1-like isoform X2 [Contarinia nasturtii]|uniref:peptidoglycan-recognition protein 1-like isoform X2 n=1 Tax=Contarinia nasturtii TaxID=265458 RepID=UPI0012D448B2|nr:peptidoglycan-recognition protein 1-like isoform X2 [Contarinia nasturtii]
MERSNKFVHFFHQNQFMMKNDNEFPSKLGYEDLDLESGYYDSSNYESTNVGFFGQRDVDDRTPLLNRPHRLRPNCIDARVFSLGVLFIGGITVGTYLLRQQDRPWPMTTAGVWLDLVTREDWGSELPTGRRLSSNNVSHVLLHHTSTENCWDLSKCIMFLHNYQKMWHHKENIDIPFNYLIGGDGRAYEVRGWSFESDHSPIHRNTSLSIALIGNFTETVPSVKQLNAVWALLLELKFQKKISRNCHIVGVSEHKRAHHDGAALFREFSMFLTRQTSKWECWDEVYSVY